jgi:hypothetical protein
MTRINELDSLVLLSQLVALHDFYGSLKYGCVYSKGYDKILCNTLIFIDFSSEP